jgi:uncharacterized circularly permuted ATP-grasp superfamily protein
MFDGGAPRPHYASMLRALEQLDAERYVELHGLADLEALSNGITFTVYADNAGTERIFPFSLVPRIVEQGEWAALARGLEQRISALNMFLQDA